MLGVLSLMMRSSAPTGTVPVEVAGDSDAARGTASGGAKSGGAEPGGADAVRDHFLALDPTTLTVDDFEKHLLAAEKNILAVGAARGTPRSPLFEGCSPSPLTPSYASAAAAHDYQTPTSQQLLDWYAGRGVFGGRGRCPYIIRTGPRTGHQCTGFHTEQRCFPRLSDAWRAKFPDAPEFPTWADLLRHDVFIFDLDYEAILAAMYALSVSAEGDCYLCVPPTPGITPGIAPAALGACESAPPGPAPAQALHTFTLDSGASRCFFRDSTTVTPLPAPVPVSLADPSRGQVLARSSTVLPCPAVPSGELSGLHLPSFSTNLPPPNSALRQVLSLPSSTGLPLQPGSPLPAPSPYTEQPGGLAERCEPASRPVSPVSSGRRVPSQSQPAVSGPPLVVRRPFSLSPRVPLPPPPASSLPVVADPASDRFRAEHSTVTRLLATVVSDPSFESAAASALVTELVAFAAHCRLDYAASLVAESASDCPPSVGGDPDAPDIPTLRSCAEAIAGEYSSQWKTTMDAEMASWKSTGTYVDEVPPPGANIVSGMWIFRVKRPLGSPPVFKARYVARGFSQREGVDFFQTFSPTPKMTTLRVLLHVAVQRDYELYSLDFSTAFIQGNLHEEIWLRHPPGFTGTTLAALGLAPSTADPSLFLRTDTSLPPFYVLVYVDDLVFATADTEALALAKSELQKRHTCTDMGELRNYLGL
ncbi:unnamed protein product [Closterium sp. NIES-53]